ncbi:hypothetical protein SDC9_158218 [bioreactor metagenome]|uniref:Uncharacterized protein n=1 Tax=bioreactor metagenome TaxID=1076179 RepID=A0A645F9E8_9ZZZZ
MRTLLAFRVLVLLFFNQEGDLFLQVMAQLIQIQLLQQHLDCFGADTGTELAALGRILLHDLAISHV